MSTSYFTPAVLIAFAAFTLGSQAAESRELVSAGTVPAHMVVTVEARHGTEVPEIKRDDVVVRQGKECLQIIDWMPLRGEHAGLELFVLVDDTLAPMSLAPQVDDLRRFINSQPNTTAIGP
jgi:hypothetical protein